MDTLNSLKKELIKRCILNIKDLIEFKSPFTEGSFEGEQDPLTINGLKIGDDRCDEYAIYNLSIYIACLLQQDMILVIILSQDPRLVDKATASYFLIFLGEKLNSEKTIPLGIEINYNEESICIDGEKGKFKAYLTPISKEYIRLAAFFIEQYNLELGMLTPYCIFIENLIKDSYI